MTCTVSSQPPCGAPQVLGGDVAGTVEEADEGSPFKKGDKVFALTPGAQPPPRFRPPSRRRPPSHRWRACPLRPPCADASALPCAAGFFNATPDGCYAEYVVADEAWLARVPDNLPLEAAAGVPLVALTGWQALLQAGAKEAAGKRAFVNAAAGGVGHITVQARETAAAALHCLA